MVRVYVPAPVPPAVQLPDTEAHHVTRVLRLRQDDEVVVFDGRGREWTGRLASLEKRHVTVELLAERVPLAEPSVAVTLGVALLKGDQMDEVVRDATALGVAAIVPVISTHVALSERARTARSAERWTRVAVAAAKQCGRAVVPSIAAPVLLEAVLARSVETLTMCCVEPAAQAGLPDATFPGRPARALLLVGPEGGWAADEMRRLDAMHAHRLSFGPRTLRASLAPVVALSVLWNRWGWW